jgi:hypothetical protein
MRPNDYDWGHAALCEHFWQKVCTAIICFFVVVAQCFLAPAALIVGICWIIKKFHIFG